MNNDQKFCFIDLFYSPFKKFIKEELPLCETFPYTYDTNRCKSFYSNITLSDGMNVNFDDIIKNINSFITKMENKPEKNNKTVVIFDNLSTIILEKKNFIDQFNLIYKNCFEKVYNLIKIY